MALDILADLCGQEACRLAGSVRNNGLQIFCKKLLRTVQIRALIE